MDLIRRNMFFIICGLATAGGIALGVTGIQSMPKVKTEMENVGTVFRNLDGLQSKPVNRDRIEAERERIQSVVADRNAVIKRGLRLYGYDQLVTDVLPEGTSVKRIEFRKRYVQSMKDLFASLTAGSPADSLLINEMRDKIENEEAERRAGRLDPGAAIRVPDVSGPPRTPSGVLTKSGAARDERSYVYTVATRHALNFRRGNSRRAERNRAWSESEAQSASGRTTPDYKRHRRIDAALRGLSPMQRGVVVLRFYHDLTLAETADAVGCSVSSARVHLARGLEAMRRVLEQKGDEVMR